MKKTIIVAAQLCVFFLSRDITRSLRGPAQERQSFVAAVDADNNGDDTVTFSTGGWNNDVLVVKINADTVEKDVIAAEILHGTEDVGDINFREFLHLMGFKRIQIGNSAALDIDFKAPISTENAEIEEQNAG